MNNGNIFVRSRDKVIVSDLLFSVYNVFLSQPKNIVIDTNAKFYDEPTIWKEKMRLFEAIGKKAQPRRQTEKLDAKIKNKTRFCRPSSLYASLRLWMALSATLKLLGI